MLKGLDAHIDYLGKVSFTYIKLFKPTTLRWYREPGAMINSEIEACGLVMYFMLTADFKLISTPPERDTYQHQLRRYNLNKVKFILS
jgi:hypothetical protein